MKTKFVNALKPAESYTHTHTHTGNRLLSQIFQNLIFSTVSILLCTNAYADTTDIAANAATSNCTNTITGTYSGTTNFEAKWTPKNITLNWYNGDTKITPSNPAANDCTYDDTLTIPTNPPSKTGYIFAGWKIKPVPTGWCGITSDMAAINQFSSSNYGYIGDSRCTRVNEDDEVVSCFIQENTTKFGLTQEQTWAIYFSYGTVKGDASCNNVGGDRFSTRPANTFNRSDSGQYCWCRMTSFTPENGTQCNPADSSWVLMWDLHQADNCSWYCSQDCAMMGAMEVLSGSGYRPVLYGLSQ